MNLEMIPYTEVDGVRTFKDSQILALIDRAERDGVLPAIFYGDSRYTKHDFLNKVKRSENMELHVVYVDGEQAGWVLLDEIRWKHATGHFCTFKEFWGTHQLIEITKWVYATLLERYSVLIGIVPEDNMYANRFVEKAGFTRLGEIPRYFHNQDRDVNGIMWCVTKENCHG